MLDFINSNKDLFDKLDLFLNTIDNKQIDLLYVLHNTQSIFGYLPKEVQLYLCEKLNISISNIENMINFYSYFKTSIGGKYNIKVCISGACSKNSGTEILEELEKSLGIKSGHTSKDFKFSLESCRCVGSCRKASVVTINGLVYDNLTVKDVPFLISQCK